MKNRRGFWTPLGIIVAVVVVVGLAAWVVFSGPALFSPGSLNAVATAQTLGGVRTHADLADDCSACHTAPWNSQTMADRCEACHQDVADELQNRSGLHGKMLAANSTDTCTGCHTEHKGANGSLTVVDVSFPHEMTGFSLKAHESGTGGEKVSCGDCHTQNLSQFDQAICATCHIQLDQTFMSSHVATFGQQCVPCHDGVDRYGENFDHNSVPFKLAGKHAAVSCAQCHTDSKTIEALQKTPQDCFACHAKDDKHKGAFGQQCNQCHTVDNWTDAQFDHSVLKQGTQDCYSCHAKDDNHQGAFGQQCGQCHSTDNWTDANFDHSVFPVNHGGEEQVATCKTCHPTDVNSYTCYGCHAHTPANVQAEHEGRSPAELEDCVSCHEAGRGGD